MKIIIDLGTVDVAQGELNAIARAIEPSAKKLSFIHTPSEVPGIVRAHADYANLDYIVEINDTFVLRVLGLYAKYAAPLVAIVKSVLTLCSDWNRELEALVAEFTGREIEQQQRSEQRVRAFAFEGIDAQRQEMIDYVERHHAERMAAIRKENAQRGGTNHV